MWQKKTVFLYLLYTRNKNCTERVGSLWMAEWAGTRSTDERHFRCTGIRREQIVLGQRPRTVTKYSHSGRDGHEESKVMAQCLFM